ncbi:MAG: SDR family NAD(P)-dependent oxidoreductase, partial [Woeseiaceae bacterium]|nr:SDR family NAD(P)-dependent oxidoreductase [Woeseiaceae bacterium]
MDLATAKAVITGGASGLGYATAERVIAAGGHVVLLDVNDEQGNSSAAALGDRAAFVKTDVSDEDAVRDAMKQA